MHSQKSLSAQTRRKKLVYIRNNWQLYIFFALPAVLLTFIFKYLPMGGLAIAFENYNNRLGIFGSEWIWFENFQRFLSSTEFPRLMINTLKLSVYGLLWGFFPPIILAILLSRVRRVGLRKKIQLLIYAPNFISVIVLAGMVIAFLSPVGPINAALVIQFILSAGQIMNIGFEKALALQTDLNRSASEIIPTYVYRLGLEIGDYGYSTAVGLFNAVINVALPLAVNAIVSRLNDGEGLIDPEVFTHDYNTYVSKAASDRYGLFLAWDNTSAGTPDNYVALPPLNNADGQPAVTRQNAMGFEIGRCVITGTNPNPALTAKWIDLLYDPIQSIQDNWGTYGDTTQDNVFAQKEDGTLEHLAIPEGVVPYELRMKTNLGGPLAVLDSYYGVYTTMPSDATLRLEGIAQLFAPAMESDYNYPPIFFDMDTTDRITQIETDLKPYAESQKVSWIMNGSTAEEWDDCIARLNEMNLPELLQLKQTGLDAYFASMGR